MSSLFFLCEVLGFALVAYWTYTNDQLGPKGGSKGLLRMMDLQPKAASAARKRGPRWRQNHREETAQAAPATASRTRRRPQAERAEPAWKRRLG